MPKGMLAGIAVLLVTVALCPAAQAQDIDPALRADVEKLLQVTGAFSNAQRMAMALSTQMIDAMKRQQPQVPDRAVEVIKDVISTEFARAFDAPDGLRSDMVKIYASHFTRPEIAALLDFYGTEIGKKSIAVMPQITEEGALAGQKWATANLPHIMETLQQRLRGEGLIK